VSDDRRTQWERAIADIDPTLRAVVRRLATRAGRGWDAALREDMQQAARLVLGRALECHDPAGPAKWRTYAELAATRAARRELASHGPIRVPYHEHPLSGRRRAKFKADADRALDAHGGGDWDIASPDADPARSDRLDWPAVVEALRALTDRERVVLVRRFGLDGAPPSLAREIGAALGITRQGVMKIERRALGRLRDRLGLTPDDDGPPRAAGKDRC
jgi:RNA polymerase sigma factor (sigma-70 family)